MGSINILSPIGILGYGIPQSSVRRAIDNHDIDAIGVDAGSIDPGPNYLGQGENFADENLVERDLYILIKAAAEIDVPVLVGTSGGAGSRVHVDRTMETIKEILAEEGLQRTVAKLYTDVSESYLLDKIRADDVRPTSSEEELTAEQAKRAERVVGQIGPEPFIDALDSGADIILGGRSNDVAPFAALPISEGFDRGLVYHLAKILECGSHATVSGSGDDCLVGTITDDYFEVIPTNPEKEVTVDSVAAHTLYEKADPHTLTLPDGVVDVSEAMFTKRGGGQVRVSGSTYSPADEYSILLEGVEKRGWRTISPAGVRDPEVIKRIDTITAGATKRVGEVIDVPEDRYELSFRVFGRDAVPLSDVDRIDDAGEIGVIIDAVGETQEIANSVCGLARSTLLHYSFPERLSTGGNLAFPYSPSDIKAGPVYSFTIYHLLQNVEPTEIVESELEVVG